MDCTLAIRLCILTAFVAWCCTTRNGGNKLLRGGSWHPGQKLSKLDPELLLELLEPACAGTVREHSVSYRDTARANGMTSGRDWQGPPN